MGLAAGCASVACVAAAAMVVRRARSWMKWWKVLEVLEELEKGCATPVARLRQVVDAMAVEMHAGLASEGGSKLKMLLTHVDNLPNGYVRIHLHIWTCIWLGFSVICVSLRWLYLSLMWNDRIISDRVICLCMTVISAFFILGEFM